MFDRIYPINILCVQCLWIILHIEMIKNADRYAIQALMYFDYLRPPFTAHQDMKQKPTILHYDENEREWPIWHIKYNIAFVEMKPGGTICYYCVALRFHPLAQVVIAFGYCTPITNRYCYLYCLICQRFFVFIIYKSDVHRFLGFFY